ncbi:MAG TPA: hypothetical protein VF618_25075 [Thermoanaerobaculia bacterium]
MADQTPETPELPPPSPPDDDGPPAVMPRWVPILIGTVLVIIAGFAVFTGLRYRDNTLTGLIRGDDPPRRPTRATHPGEQEPGGSLMSDTTPAAHPPVAGSARAVVSGGPQGVSATVRIWASRGMIFDVTPKDAAIYVNDVAMGQVSQFDSPDEVYDFPQPGSYNVRVVAPGIAAERHFIVTAADDAPNELARIQAKFD